MSKELNLAIEGMTCGHCEMSVTKELSKLDGSANVTVDAKSGKATLQVADTVQDEDVEAAVTGAGYKLVAVNG
jgi:copper chaperone CopZ